MIEGKVAGFTTMRKSGIVRVFLVEFQHGRVRQLWRESLSASVAMELGRKLAVEGLKPVVRRLDIPTADA